MHIECNFKRTPSKKMQEGLSHEQQEACGTSDMMSHPNITFGDHSYLKQVLTRLNLTPDRFPNFALSYLEISSVFDMKSSPFSSIPPIDSPNSIITIDNSDIIYFEKIGQSISSIMARIFKEKKCFHKRDLPTIWIEARQLFIDYLLGLDKSAIYVDSKISDYDTAFSKDLSLLDNLRVHNVENCWKLYCEELWWRLYKFTTYQDFSQVPQIEKPAPFAKEDDSALIEEVMSNLTISSNSGDKMTSKKELKRLRNKKIREIKKQQRAEVSSESPPSGVTDTEPEEKIYTKKVGFFLTKQSLDNIRYFVWGYHFAFNPEWYMKDILDMHFKASEVSDKSPFERFDNIVLLDLDNVGQSIFMLKERNFEYGPSVLMIGVAGPRYSTSIKVSEEMTRERDSGLHFVKIRMMEGKGYNLFERYISDFYESGYFKKYKDIADYLLGGLAGALHRVASIKTRIFIVSKDDGLRHIQKSLIVRGRPSFLVTSQESLIETLDNYLLETEDQYKRLTTELQPTLSKFYSSSIQDLAQQISSKTSDYEERVESIPIESVKDSFVSDDEKFRVYTSTTGVAFGRDKVEQIMGDYIFEYYSKCENQVFLDNIRIKGRRLSFLGWNGIVKSLNLPHVHLTNLEEIDVRGCRIEDEGAIELFKVLHKCTKLTLLDLGACFLTDKSCPSIASYLSNKDCNLKTLDLRWNSIGAKGGKMVMDALEHNSSLTSISFRLNPFESVGSNYVVQKALEFSAGNRLGFSIDVRQATKTSDMGFIFHNMYERTIASCKRGDFSAPITLDISGAEIQPTGAIHLSHFLEQLSDTPRAPYEITKLFLDYNNLGDEGTEYLARGLLRNNSIIMLTLGRNYVQEKGAICLAELLKQNQTLTHLDLQKNKIGQLGAFAISNALCDNQVLTYLNLKCNYIGDLGALALANAISPLESIWTNEPKSHNESLLHIDLTNNRITNVSAKYLVKALEKNENLCRINLSNNPDMLSDPMIDLTKGFYSLDTSEYQDLNTGTWWLEVSDCSLKDKAMQSLQNFLHKPLSHLVISGNVIGDYDYSSEVKEIIHNFYNGIDSYSENIAISSLNSLFFNTYESLSCVDLRTVSIGDDDLSLLFNEKSILFDRMNGSKPSNIFFLNLAGNHITSNGACHIKRMLENNSSITCLILNYNNLGDAGFSTIVESLDQNQTLTSLSIRRNDIGDKGALVLSEYMKNRNENALLGYIDLESNLITDVGAAYMSEGFKTEGYDSIYFMSVERNLLTEVGNRKLLESASRKLTSGIDSGIIQTIHLSL